MKMLLNDGKNTTECGADPSLDPYEMRMSKGVNECIWNLSGAANSEKHERIVRLMAACSGQGKTHGQEEFVILRMMQMAYHMEWILGMLASPENHRVLLEDPQTVMDSFKALCLEMADIQEGPAAKNLEKGMERAQKQFKQVQEDMESSWLVEGFPGGASYSIKAN